MKVSIVISVLDSHEILRRQLLYMEKMGIPDDTEIIIVDDGSKVPLEYHGSLPVRILRLEWPERKWTASIARNRGVAIAKGEYILAFDLDHFINKELLDMVRTFGGYKVQFLRSIAVILEDGSFCQDPETLFEWGYPKSRYMVRGFGLTPHPNMYAMRKDIFLELGGYDEYRVLNRQYPQGEDSYFKSVWQKKVDAGIYHVHTERPTLYTFPTGKLCGDVDFNPKGLFHNLSRATPRNQFYKKQVAKYGHNRDIHFA